MMKRFAQGNIFRRKSVITQVNVKLGKNVFSHLSGTIQKYNLGGAPLRVALGCQYSWKAGKAVSLLLRPRCTTLMGFIDETQETIAVAVFSRPQNGYF